MHPASDPEHVFVLKTDAVDIIINPNGETDETEIEVRDKKSNGNQDMQNSDGGADIFPDEEERISHIRPLDLKHFMPAKFH